MYANNIKIIHKENIQHKILVWRFVQLMISVFTVIDETVFVYVHGFEQIVDWFLKHIISVKGLMRFCTIFILVCVWVFSGNLCLQLTRSANLFQRKPIQLGKGLQIEIYSAYPMTGDNTQDAYYIHFAHKYNMQIKIIIIIITILRWCKWKSLYSMSC